MGGARVPDSVLRLGSDVLRYRVCTVIATAGWGKTTAVGRALRGRRVVWMTLRPSDDEARAFACRLQDLSGSATGNGSEPLADVLASLGSKEPVLVLDDVQELAAGSETARLLDELCRLTSVDLHLVLISQREVPLSLARLRGQGVVREVTARDLALGSTQVAGLVRARLGEAALPGASQLGEISAGWPAVVAQAARGVDGWDVADWQPKLERMLTRGGELYTYLHAEVVEREPDRVRHWLRPLAVLGKVSTATCVDLGFDDAGAVLACLARRGLVREHSAGWSLQRPLRAAIAGDVPADEARSWHRLAATALVHREQYAAALRHLDAAGEHIAATELVTEHGAGLIEQGAAAALPATVELAPGASEDIHVQRVLGLAEMVRGKPERALTLYRQVAGVEGLDPILAWQLAMTCYLRGDFCDALDVCRRARQVALDTPGGVLVLALQARAHAAVGNLEAGMRCAERALRGASNIGETSARAAAHAALAEVAMAGGDQRLVQAHLPPAVRAAEMAGNELTLAGLRLLRAFHLIERGSMEQALRQTNTAMEFAEKSGCTVAGTFALTHRARIHLRAGRHEEALADFERAGELFGSFGSRWMAWPLCGIADIRRARGQLAQAEAGYQEALELAEPQHDVFALSCALTGLARVSAPTDIRAAEQYADRAVALGPGLRRVQALLTRGWVALLADQREVAADNAAGAAELARRRWDQAGLAEALELNAVSGVAADRRVAVLEQAAQLWQQLGHPVEEAKARLLAVELAPHRLGGQRSGLTEELRDRQVRLTPPLEAGPLAVLSLRTSRVSIRALGALLVYRGGSPVPDATWRSRKARDLLRILLSRRNRPVPREQLCELLWPEEDSRRAANRLSVLLSTVRAVLQPADPAMAEPVHASMEAIWLDRDQLDIDVDRFLHAAATALEHARSGSPATMVTLTSAEELYTGDFLEDCPYADWAVALRDEAREAYLDVLRALADSCRSAGDQTRAVRCCVRLLGQDAYDEGAHLQLVDSLIRAGRHGEAHRRYCRYRARMRELGVNPQPPPRVECETAPS